MVQFNNGNILLYFLAGLVFYVLFDSCITLLLQMENQNDRQLSEDPRQGDASELLTRLQQLASSSEQSLKPVLVSKHFQCQKYL